MKYGLNSAFSLDSVLQHCQSLFCSSNKLMKQSDKRMDGRNKLLLLPDKVRAANFFQRVILLSDLYMSDYI